ncbi:MAG: DegV family protein [Dermatophilaceae bacterium]
MSVAVVTDSTAYLPPELVAGAPGYLGVVPLHVVIGGREHREGVDVNLADLAAALRGFRPVTTSMPAPQDFLNAYAAAVHAGASGIVSVHISGELSGTCSGAALAAQQASVPVVVVDSRTIGMALGYAVLSACEAAAAGEEADAVAAVAHSRAAEATVDFYVDTLEHLRRGGRIGAASAMVGSALAIKPILAVREGRIEPVEKVRTSARAFARLVELAVTAGGAAGARGVDLAVQHLDSAERAHDLAGMLRARVPGVRDVVVGELGAVVGAHVGPGTVAVTVSPRPQQAR